MATGWTLNGTTMTLDSDTTARWDSDDGLTHDECRREIMRDANILHAQLGYCRVETCDGIVLEVLS